MREYHSEQEWKLWIDNLNASGLSVKDWSEEHGLKTQTVSRWKGRIKKRYPDDATNSGGPWVKMGVPPLTAPSLTGQGVVTRCLGTQSQSSCFCVTVGDVQITVPASYADDQLARLIKIARTS
jgi:hypothetical protein